MNRRDLLEQLRASLADDEAYRWRKRLLTERLMRNITEKHERALLHLRSLIEGGDDQPSHGQLAEALSISISVIKDALSRARALGLVDWTRQHDILANGSRRQRANRYRLCMPQQAPQSRPDVRRHRAASFKSPSATFLPTWSPHSGERNWQPPAEFEALRTARIIAKARADRAARAVHRPP